MKLWHEADGGGALDAETVLTIHGGLGFDHVYMKRSFARLARPDRQVVFYDQRANGRSTDFDVASITMERLADDAVDLLDELGVERATVLGHSYGGFVAQECAVRHPARVERLVLIDTTPGELGDQEQPDEHGVGPALPEAAIEALGRDPQTDAEFHERLPELLPWYLHDRSDDMVKRLLAAAEGTTLRAAPLNHGFALLGHWSVVDRLDRITAPTLVIVGRHDLVTAWPQSMRIATRIPNSEVVVFENSGHFPWIEEPDAFWPALENWLDR